MKNLKIGLFLIVVYLTMGLEFQASAASLSQNSFIAGKAVVVTVKNDSGVDITTQSTLFFAGSELKISTFAGKPTLQGITAGSDYDVTIKNTASGVAIGHVLVSVSPAPFYKLAIIAGNSQSVTAGSQAPQTLVVQAQDLYKNGVAGQSLSVTLPGSTLNLITDSNGLAQIPYTAGVNTGTEYISVVAGSSSVSFNEKVIAGPNGVAAVKIGSIPSSIDMGAPMSVNVSLVDSTGSPVLGAYPGVLTGYLNSTCTSVNPNIEIKTVANLVGTLSFSGVSDSVQETMYLGVSAGGHRACSSAIVVKPALGAVSKITFSQAPTSGKSGVSLFPPPMIQLQDSNSRIVTTSSDSISVSAYSDSACSVAVPATGNIGSASSGKLTLNSFKVTYIGSVYIQATADGVNSSCMGPVSLVSALPNPCGAGLHYNSMNSSCDADVVDCNIRNGTSQKVWNPNILDYGACVFSACLPNFHKTASGTCDYNDSCKTSIPACIGSKNGDSLSGIFALNQLTALINSGGSLTSNVILENNLDFSEVQTPNTLIPTIDYGVIFDGNNNQISNWTSTSPIVSSNNGTIRNLNIINFKSNFTTPAPGGFYPMVSYMGAIQYNYGSIDNISITGIVYGNQDSGILSSSNRGNISNIKANVTILSSYASGGLVGRNYGNMSKLDVTGSVGNLPLATGESLGGIVGRNYGYISNSSFNGQVQGATLIGGIAGGNWSGNIDSVYVSGTVTNNTASGSVGGILGGLFYSGLTNSFMDGKVVASLSNPNAGVVVGTLYQYYSSNLSYLQDSAGLSPIGYINGQPPAPSDLANVTSVSDATKFNLQIPTSYGWDTSVWSLNPSALPAIIMPK